MDNKNMNSLIQQKKRALWYVGISYGISWAFIGLFLLFGGEWQGGTGASTFAGFVYMWIPGITALVFTKALDHENIRQALKLYFKPNRWFAMALLLPLITAFVTNEIGLLLPMHEYSPDMEGFFSMLADNIDESRLEMVRTLYGNLPINPILFTILSGLLNGITIGALFALGEEFAWRGYLVYTLYRGRNFWFTALVIGLIWGVWHAPIVLLGHNYPEHPVIGVGMMTVYCLLLGIPVLWVRLKSGSVVAAAVYHGFSNALFILPLLYLAGGSDLTRGATGAAGLMGLAVTVVVLIVLDKFVFAESLIFPEADTDVNSGEADVS